MHGETRVLYGRFGRVAALWPGNNLVPHAHKDAHIVLSVGSTPAVATVGARTIALECSSAVAINPFEVHSFKLLQPSDRPVLVTFYINPDWLQARHGLSALVPFANAQFKIDEIIRETGCSFVDAVESNAAMGDSLAVEIELFLDSLVGRVDHPCQGAYGLNPQRSDFRVRRAMIFMQQHIDMRAPLDAVARQVGLSRPHFFSLFHDQTHMTPKIYWNLLRIDNALEQIRAGCTPLGEVAFNLGFSSQGNFSRFFREHTGVSPLCYRRATV